MKQISILSPAKLNLYLKVNYKRKDGFHDITTLFERINLCDKIDITTNNSNKIKISCNHPHVPVGKKNLVYRVAQMLKDEYGIEDGLNIHIHKNIPVAAGLAGGSSNAASTLLALNKLWNIGVSTRKIISYASMIGSDVPFFLYNTSYALGTERGNKIKKINIRTKLYHIIVVPRVKMYTPEVYGALKMKFSGKNTAQLSGKKPHFSNNLAQTNVLTKKKDDVNILIHNLRKKNTSNVSCLLTNDLESAIYKIRPELFKIKERFRANNINNVLISGSGPSVYGVVQTKKEAEKAKELFSRRYSQVFVANTY